MQRLQTFFISVTFYVFQRFHLGIVERSDIYMLPSAFAFRTMVYSVYDD